MSALKKPKARVLVVDDERIVHDSVGRILAGEGYEMDSALRVDDALDLLSKHSYDVVLTDLMMPDDSGMKAVEAVARDHPDCGVVMFTGFATVESAVESMKLGALDYLPKPFTPEELIEVLNRALGKTLKARRDREIVETYTEAEKALRSSLDLKEILNLISSSVVQLLKVKGSCVYIRKPDQTLEMASSKGLSEEYLAKGVLTTAESVPEVFEEGQSVIINADEFDLRLQYPEEARKEGIAFIMSVPLKLEDAILGLLRIYGSEQKSLTEDESDILSKFADQCARAIENAMAYEKVRKDVEGIKQYIPDRGTK
jgi:YesN/AraC family two-component response regulator